MVDDRRTHLDALDAFLTRQGCNVQTILQHSIEMPT